ncbi:hypothetical protein D3C75_851630 [compost metagenome]
MLDRPHNLSPSAARNAYFLRNGLNKIIDAQFVGFDDPGDEVVTLIEGSLRVAFECSSSCGDRGVHLFHGRHCDRCKNFFGGRVNQFLPVGCRGFYPFTVDIELGVILHLAGASNCYAAGVWNQLLWV